MASHSDEPLKSNRGRPRNPNRKDDWHVKVDPDLSVYFRMKNLDEFTKTTRIGSLSELINRLLREEMMRELSPPGS